MKKWQNLMQGNNSFDKHMLTLRQLVRDADEDFGLKIPPKLLTAKMLVSANAVTSENIGNITSNLDLLKGDDEKLDEKVEKRLKQFCNTVQHLGTEQKCSENKVLYVETDVFGNPIEGEESEVLLTGRKTGNDWEAEKARCIKNNLCFTCKEAGHRSQDCPVKAARRAAHAKRLADKEAEKRTGSGPTPSGSGFVPPQKKVKLTSVRPRIKAPEDQPDSSLDVLDLHPGQEDILLYDPEEFDTNKRKRRNSKYQSDANNCWLMSVVEETDPEERDASSPILGTVHQPQEDVKEERDASLPGLEAVHQPQQDNAEERDASLKVLEAVHQPHQQEDDGLTCLTCLLSPELEHQPQHEERDAGSLDLEAAKPTLMLKRRAALVDNNVYQIIPKKNPRKNKHFKTHFSRWFYIMDVNGKIRNMPRNDVLQKVPEETEEEIELWKVLDEEPYEVFKDHLDKYIDEVEDKSKNLN